MITFSLLLCAFLGYKLCVYFVWTSILINY
jgi:hypothetical protein